MGTRATVKFYSEYGEDVILASTYHQWDGDYAGVGLDLAMFLKDKKVINGISGQTMSEGYANGMGCLAAQYIAKEKDIIGSFYMTTENDEQGYDYEVRFIDGKLNIRVDAFSGTPEEYIKMNGE